MQVLKSMRLSFGALMSSSSSALNSCIKNFKKRGVRGSNFPRRFHSHVETL